MLVGEEKHLPYDRPPLSKDLLAGERSVESVFLRDEQRFAALDVELVLGTRATALDLRSRQLLLGDARLPFDGLILATGAAARRLPGLDGPDVHLLRTLDDALALRTALESARSLAVVGAGFIGSEVASTARARGIAVTVVELEEIPLARVLGPQLGAACARLHVAAGTDLRLGVTVAERLPGAVRLTDGSTVEADAVVVGAGAVPAVAWLEGSGLELGNGVVCDETLSAGVPGVYAVGDIASWPNELFGRRQRVEHWTNAAEQARHAARNLLHGRADPFLGSNYVWSDQYGVRIQFVGVKTDDVEVVAGSLDEGPFLAWYREDGRLVGALAIGMPREAMKTKLAIEARLAWADALRALEE